ncbi:MAG: DDE-type integrase/transposase/recombinase [Candidatus Nanoarchaeia archaeon]|nr:DDE-type integrase/transposase/recombinase [Candidatus Nanoarchaeia archaeon]
MINNTTYPQVIGTREDRGKAIAEKAGQIIRINDNSYKVKSQSSDALYDVKSTEIGWKCTCLDHTTRGVKCKHIISVEVSFNLRKEIQKTVVIQPIEITDCIFCHSKNIKKFGVRHNKHYDIQKFYCNNCHQHFSYNIGFEKLKHNPQAVTTAMQLYFSGESLRNTKNSLKLIGVQVSHQTILNWIERYTNLMKQYVEKLNPQVSDTWRADEVFVKFSGNMKYLFALMDDETRYWIAQEVADTKFKHDAQSLFHEGKELMGRRPNTLITDGLPAYHDAFNREFYTNSSPRSKHINAIKLDGDMNNNKMERINGEIRDREKVMRGLKKKDTPILKGYQIYHNYVRPHQSLNGKTPAEACGIKVEGDNKWITLIQNASINSEHKKITPQ